MIDFYFLGCASQGATGGLVWLVDAWMSDWPGGSDWKFAGRFGLEVCLLDDAGDSFRILGETLSFFGSLTLFRNCAFDVVMPWTRCEA